MILHVDMDAFYASVEERERPELQGKPVIVGGSPQRRGVVCAANYVARQFGVHSAMPSATAVRLCPQAVFLPTRMEYYAEISRQIRHIFQRFTPIVEPLSLDEAFLDVQACEALFGSAVTIARQIQDTIYDETQLVASVGVAPNKFLAKIASDLRKPAGFVVVAADQVQQFLDPLPVQRIWGVGRQTNKLLKRLNVSTIQQLRQLPLDVLGDNFGSQGEHLWKLAHGIDNRQVIPDREAKSISHETTFAADIEDLDVLRAWLMELTEQVARRMRRHGLKGRTVQIKIRYSDFSTHTRSHKLGEPTNSTDALWQTACDLLSTKLPAKRLLVRLLGMGVSDFDCGDKTQRHLFDEDSREKQTKLDKVSDQVKDRFGTKALRRGGSMHE